MQGFCQGLMSSPVPAISRARGQPRTAPLMKEWCARRDSNSRPFGSKGKFAPNSRLRRTTKSDETLDNPAASLPHIGRFRRQFTDRKRTTICRRIILRRLVPWVFNPTCHRNSKRQCALHATVRELYATINAPHPPGFPSPMHCPSPSLKTRLRAAVALIGGIGAQFANQSPVAPPAPPCCALGGLHTPRVDP